MTVTRFAPSPTGELHLGHVYAAKVARDLARKTGGRFLLRHEDIDTSRVRAEFYEKIEEDLKWLGLDWDGEAARQSERQAAYRDAIGKLEELGLVYPCFCTRKDIRAALSAPHGTHAVYPGTCRGISDSEATRRMDAGEAHSWRFDATKAGMVHGSLTFQDLRFGKSPVNPEVNGDAVLARKDIGIAYHLAVVIDDEFQEITNVTRGEDLLDSTHIHRQLQAVLGLREPNYLHHALVCDTHGKRLAKRDEARSVGHLRESGHTPAEVLAMAQP